MCSSGLTENTSLSVNRFIETYAQRGIVTIIFAFKMDNTTAATFTIGRAGIKITVPFSRIVFK